MSRQDASTSTGSPIIEMRERRVRIDVVTLFPDMVAQAAGFRRDGQGAGARIVAAGLVESARFHDGQSQDRGRPAVWRRTGMVMLAEPLAQAIAAAKAAQRAEGVRGAAGHPPVAGRRAADARAGAGAGAGGRCGLCAARRALRRNRRAAAGAEADEEIAIGDFVVSGGELPALMLIDAMARQLPGALNDEQSAQQDSFADGPARLPALHAAGGLEGVAVPDVLLSGHHADIRRWRLKQSLGRTWERRPDLLVDRALTQGGSGAARGVPERMRRRRTEVISYATGRAGKQNVGARSRNTRDGASR